MIYAACHTFNPLLQMETLTTTESARQTVQEVNDEGLRHLIHDCPKVFAKFTSDNCPTCEALAAPFIGYASDGAYQSIVFLRLDSDENPVPKQMMAERVAPFFVSYCQGRLLECDALTMEADMRAQLDRLRDFVPPAA